MRDNVFIWLLIITWVGLIACFYIACETTHRLNNHLEEKTEYIEHPSLEEMLQGHQVTITIESIKYDTTAVSKSK